jgi:hypothetical protein
MRALREMMMSGSGRAVLESQILQESSIARLLSIVRGEELPPRPEPVAETAQDEAGSESSADASAAAAVESAAENTTEDEVA